MPLQRPAEPQLIMSARAVLSRSTPLAFLDFLSIAPRWRSLA